MLPGRDQATVGRLVNSLRDSGRLTTERIPRDGSEAWKALLPSDNSGGVAASMPQGDSNANGQVWKSAEIEKLLRAKRMGMAYLHIRDNIMPNRTIGSMIRQARILRTRGLLDTSLARSQRNNKREEQPSPMAPQFYVSAETPEEIAPMVVQALAGMAGTYDHETGTQRKTFTLQVSLVTPALMLQHPAPITSLPGPPREFNIPDNMDPLTLLKPQK